MSFTSAYYRKDATHNSGQTAELGARHPIVYNAALQDFFEEVDTAFKSIIPDAVSSDEWGREQASSSYRLYDDPDRIGSTVVEARTVRELSKKQRVRWNRNDVGAVAGDITDRIGRLAMAEDVFTDEVFTVSLSDALKVGVDTNSKGQRKIAAIIDPECPSVGFIAQEHEIVIDSIASRIRGFEYPHELTAKLTLARLSRQIAGAKVDECVEAVKEILQTPVQATVERMRLFSGSREL